MHSRHLASPRPRALVVAAAALIVWASFASLALGAPNKKTFSATAGPLVAGHTYSGTDTILLTLKNTSTSAELGSANISVPSGVAATSPVGLTGVGSAILVGTVIQLRNLALTPGQTAIVTVSAQVECGKNNAAYTWATATKQSNDFNGTGNDLTGASPSSVFSGTCALVFSKQPKSAEKAPVAITNAIYDPNGDAVTVTVQDGSGTQTVTWWSGTISLVKGDDPSGGAAVLGGGGPAPVVGGSATFAPTISLSATGYSLVPTASPDAGSASVGTTSPGAESANFNIVDDATICAANTGCFAEAGQGQKTSAKVDASATGADGDLIILTINDPTVSINCGGYTETSDVIVFNVTDSTGEGDSIRSKIATLTLLEEFVTKSASKYRVCYDNGVDTPSLLENCSNQSPVPPCVVSKAINQEKDLVIVVSTPPGDPGLKF